MKKNLPRALLVLLLCASTPMAFSADPCVTGEDIVSVAGRNAEQRSREKVRAAQDGTNVATDAAKSCLDRVKAALTLSIPGFSLGDFDKFYKAILDRACQAVVNEVNSQVGTAQRGVNDAFRGVGVIEVGGFPVVGTTRETVGVGTTSGSSSGSSSKAVCALFGTSC